MKKLISVIFTIAMLAGVASCGVNGVETEETHRPHATEEATKIETEAVTTVVTTAPPATPPPPTTEPPPPELTPEEKLIAEYQPVADEIAEAFINKNTEYLSEMFGDRSGKGFEFLHELEFAEFSQTGTSTENGAAFYFNIFVEYGIDDIFTLGGQEWELQLGSSWRRIIYQFSPKGKDIEDYSEYASMCAAFSTRLHLLETMDNFNLIKQDFN